MNILVIGSGGREHAIIRKLKESPKTEKLWCAPGNGGIAADAECVAINAMDIDGVVDFAKKNAVDLVFVAPDDPLAAGMVDALEKEGIRAFGPRANAAIIESSKVFSKNLMKKYGIPTADYAVFSDPKEVVEYVEKRGKFPVVIKADGLALGKGVIIAQNFDEAKDAVHTIMEDKVFGASGNNVVVEEFLTGPEVSVLAFTDGKTLRPMVSSKDHKRALDGDKGLNTGGMGTISPNPYYTNEIADECMKTIFLPTVKAMQAEGRPFKGCLYFGLMLTPDGPKVIEFNARFGDPETEVVLPKLTSDLGAGISAILNGETPEFTWDEDNATLGVVIASEGYPTNVVKGAAIPEITVDDDSHVYYAGVARGEHGLVANSGRVLLVESSAADIKAAQDKVYAIIDKLDTKGMFYRHDIGFKALNA